MYFTVKLADLQIGIDGMHPMIYKMCRDYLIKTEHTVFDVKVTRQDIKAEERQFAVFTDAYLETLAVQRKISERLPYYDRFLMHGAVISFEDSAYMFSAASGTGKSTHIRLWRKYLGENVGIINGDKPFLHVGDKEITVFGTPWAGKEGWQKNCSAPLKGICFLEQGEENRIRRIRPGEGILYLLKQIYLADDPGAAGMTLELLDKMLSDLPLYVLQCDMSSEAVKVSFEEMTGKDFEDYRVMKNED